MGKKHGKGIGGGLPPEAGGSPAHWDQAVRVWLCRVRGGRIFGGAPPSASTLAATPPAGYSVLRGMRKETNRLKSDSDTKGMT